MSLIRNWQAAVEPEKDPTGAIFESGWRRVLVKRSDDFRQNVGTGSEVGEEIDTSFEIRARIDPVNGKDDARTWIGLVESHILAFVSKSDVWYTESPNKETIEVYKVITIDADEIILHREY